MPKFIDTHEMGPLTPEKLRKLQHAPKDEFGITHHDILYARDGSKVYCVLDAPNRDAVQRHHDKAGLHTEWIEEVESTRG
jgi:hypothetical protein